MSRADVVGIAGAGRFGTALAHVLARAGRQVVMWTRDRDVARAIGERRESPRLAGVALADSVRATDSAAELADAARLIVVAVASTEVRARAGVLGDHLDGGHLLVHAIGALASPGETRVSQVLCDETPVLRVGALAGPALWRDLIAAGEQPERSASMVAASRFDEVTAEARRLLGAPPVLRVYRSDDLAGVELAAALTGAYTIAVGMADALGAGPGTRAVLITRALAEASRLGEAYGADPRTFTGLAGLGNLLVRSVTEHSRDYGLGRALAAGGTPPAPSRESAGTPGSDARTEGARAALAGARLAERLGVRAPVLAAVAAVIRGDVPAARAAARIADSVADAE